MAKGADPIEAAFDEIDAEEGKSASSGLWRILSALAAIVALAVFGAIVWYAYSTGVREGSEIAAPLLKPDGPSKIAPQDPGGREILNQDMRVYGVIDRTAGGRQVERLLPPPENPLPLPVARKPAPAAKPQQKSPAPTAQLKQTGAIPNAKPQRTAAIPNAKPQRTAAIPNAKPQQTALAPVTKPPLATPKLAVPAPPPPPPAITAPAKLPPSQPIAKIAPTPAAKPAVTVVPPKPTPVIAKKTTPSNAAKPVAGKGYRVQTASLRSAGAARRAWARQVKQSGGVLAGLTLFVKRVEIPKKGTYFRVQAGPLLDKTAAQRVCTSLKRRKIGCFVVKL
jgi:hypothetical protein